MTLVPMWVAPNLITMVGLVINVVTSIVLMWACPTATEPVSLAFHILRSESCFCFTLLIPHAVSQVAYAGLRPRPLCLPDSGRHRREASPKDGLAKSAGRAL